MSDPAAPPEPDRLEGAPHPRETPRLHGQEAAEAALLAAAAGGRMPHAWLLTGPRGVGKATLAWRAARHLLAEAPDGGAGLFGEAPAPATLDVDPEHPVARRIRAGSEPRLFALRRAVSERTGKLQTVITVDEVRKLKSFFGLSAADGGRRVVIVDAADELNANAANALLKLLEEPPEGAVLFLVSHQPARLLPTIRSRCRTLPLRSLAPEALALALEQAGAAPGPGGAAALAELSGGSVGGALELSAGGGDRIYADLVALAGTMPRLDRPAAIKLADAAGAPRGPLALTVRLIELLLVRLARAGAGAPPAGEAAPGEAALLARLAPDAQAGRAWADLQQALSARAAHAQAVNLDPSSLILDMVLSMNQAASDILARARARA